MLAFILGDLINSGGFIMNGSPTDVGEIAGNTIDGRIFEAKVQETIDNYKNQSGQTTIDAATLSKLIEGNRAPEGLFFGRLSAVSTAAVGPIVVLGWFCQKQLVKGLTFGAVK